MNARDTLQLSAQALDANGRPVENVRFRYIGSGGARFEGRVDTTGLVRSGSTGTIPVTVVALVPGTRPVTAFAPPDPGFFMARSKSSSRWLQEHFNDRYVKESHKDGYRSRASYKILELQKKDRLFKPGMVVIDLGAAPGGWSQVVAPLVGDQGLVLASDVLPMDSLEGVQFVQGDFTEAKIFEQLLATLGGRPVDVVISDMAPNMSGIADVDQPKAMYLVELALDMARQVLKPNGVFVCKVFHGEGFDAWMKDCRRLFSQVATRKPDASRSRSREVYLVAKGFKPEVQQPEVQ